VIASRGRAVGLLLLVVLLGAACGKKGPPLAPLRAQPGRIVDLTARRVDADVYLRFTIPAQNQDGSRPADLGRVEVYGLTGQAVDEQGRPLDREGFLRAAMLVETIAVRPPVLPGADAAEPGTTPVPAQGEVVVVRDRLMPAPDASARPAGPAPQPAGSSMVRPLAGPVVSPLPTRTYVVVARTRRGGQSSDLSNRASISLMETPPAPPPPVISHTETAIVLEWPVAAPPENRLPSRPLFDPRPQISWNIYEADVAAEVPGPPLNAEPLQAGRFEHPSLTFGEERCYVLRPVVRHGALQVEGPVSVPACIRPVEIFPPAAPTGLQAVGGAGAISLIWDASPEPDVAGYLILRGAAPGEKLQALTAGPIRETTFRDTTVVPGVRYAYAVVAVDTAKPPNVSAESNRVEETAR
jgi:hypothetical protein